MVTKDNETRALLDALCSWLVEDAGFMPAYVDKLRDRFEVASARRGRLRRVRPKSEVENPFRKA